MYAPIKDDGEGPPSLLENTLPAAMDFCALRRRVQIHTGELFSASDSLEGRTHTIPSIQFFKTHRYRGGVTMV